MVRYFPSERAWWFGVITWGLPVILVVAVAAAFRNPPDEGFGAVVVGLLPVVLVSAFTIWIWFSTGYTVTDKDLIVRSAFMSWHIKLDKIRAIRPTRNPLSSPALSLNRLDVRWGKGMGVMISPADRDTFLQLLRERCPEADIQG